ncbi:glycosyltransferase family 4 protein [Anaerocellum diazotrophicum]|uniref:Glycosyl transferase n=1 Tax=Caldicellulosiruptor diazotrophicus TaxID=2806205 RepID=A0ABM7NJT6_9FIRM|nr:glycosyltransferase family 4 protein [Caldicellulosiruptor diazotrophicus]BCS80361.1 glycosyl transferase [Caldicellulosiruptor diazotrophicus]
MKVLLVHEFYRQYGGEDRVFEQEKRLLRENGIEVYEYTFHNSDISLFQLPFLVKNMIFNRKTYKDVKRIVRENKIDVVHCHNIFPYISPSVYVAAKESGAKVIQTLHNYRFICPNSTFYDYKKNKICTKCLDKGIINAITSDCTYDWMRNVVLALVNTIYKRKNIFDHVDKFIALTNFSKNIFVKFGIPAEKIAVKPNFIFEEDIKPVYEKEDYIIFVGRLSYEKGIMTLLQAMKELNDEVKLLIVGDGPLRDEVIKFIQKNNLKNTKYLGPQKREKVLELIGKAKFLVFPSLWFEGFPMVLLEAFSVGTPVLASNLGGIPEIVEEGVNGRLFDPCEKNNIAYIIDKLACKIVYKNTVQIKNIWLEKYNFEIYKSILGCSS